MSRLRLLCALVVLGLSSRGLAEEPRDPKRTQVFVLCTLHQLHETNPAYSFSALSAIVERLNPDILAVELTPSDLANRKEQRVKQEYQRSIFPLLEKRRYAAVALEPPEPLFSELVGAMRAADRSMAESAPQKAEAFGTYQDALYDFLARTWDSPLAVNSRQTDALFEVKHEFQSALYGPEERRGWERWNEHFLSRILDVAQGNAGKRIVVTVGVEHGYWLRKRLRGDSRLALLEPEGALP